MHEATRTRRRGDQVDLLPVVQMSPEDNVIFMSRIVVRMLPWGEMYEWKPESLSHDIQSETVKGVL